MIHYLYGEDIFKLNVDAIVNPVNTQGVMGKGLALQFKLNYPENYTLYKQQCVIRNLFVGKLFYVVEKEKIIINFPTKAHWKEPSKLKYIELGLDYFIKTYKDFDIKSVAYPKIGCGLGGLDWEKEVLPLIVRKLSSLDLYIYLV